MVWWNEEWVLWRFYCLSISKSHRQITSATTANSETMTTFSPLSRRSVNRCLMKSILPLEWQSSATLVTLCGEFGDFLLDRNLELIKDLHISWAWRISHGRPDLHTEGEPLILTAKRFVRRGQVRFLRATMLPRRCRVVSTASVAVPFGECHVGGRRETDEDDRAFSQTVKSPDN